MLSPEALVRLLAGRAFEAFAITDHDTLGALAGAQKAAGELGLLLVPGVELSTGDAPEIHVLGYFAAVPEALQQRLTELRQGREARLRQMLGKLGRMGVQIGYDELPIEPGAAPGRVHLARALVEKGCASSINQAFARYLKPGRPGYVAREKLTTAEAIRRIREAGGAPVLAHPGIIPADERLLPARVSALMEHGLMGVEVHHPRHTPRQVRALDGLARSRGLLVTGGSDYHGLPGPLQPGDGLAKWPQKDTDFLTLINTIGLMH